MALQISQTTQEKIAELLTRYPVKQGALLPILHLVQDELGALSLEALDWVARQIEVSPATVYGVATFYPMFRMDKRDAGGRNTSAQQRGKPFEIVL